MDELTRRMTDLGAPDPADWARMEVEHDIPEQAKFLFLRTIWPELIDPFASEATVRRIPAAARLLDTGASLADLAMALRTVAYDTAFGVVQRVDDGFDHEAPADAPGWNLVEVDPDGRPTRRKIRGLHEELLSLDPSGREGSDLFSD